METKEYKVGQAVILVGDNLAVINAIHPQGMYGFKPLLGSAMLFDKHESEIRPATEAEILAEIAKHGWELTDIEYITGKHINLIKTVRKGWVYGGGNSISTENLKELCEDGLVAHTIITALNLV